MRANDKCCNKNFLRLFLLCAVLLGGCLSGGGGGDSGSTGAGTPTTCTSIVYQGPVSYNGANVATAVPRVASTITFTLDKAYVCGQFANGDWWVSADSSGRVTITAISPAVTTNASGKRVNGFEVNPDTTNSQAFDESILNITFAPGKLPTLPLTMTLAANEISSVVKAVSLTDITDYKYDKTRLKYAAVLTVLGTQLNNSINYFRPAYFGASAVKKIYQVSNIQVSSFPKYAATALPSVSKMTFSRIADRYQGVQLDHVSIWIGDQIHPVDNMPDYGAQIATDNAQSLQRILLSDFDFTNNTHKSALINYLQMAVDLQAMASNGSIWPPDGGHGNGRKLPLIFAAWALNNTDFTNSINASRFAEDEQVYYSAVTGAALYGRPSNFLPRPPTVPSSAQIDQADLDYWETTGTQSVNGSRDVRDPYELIDGSGYEVGLGSYQFCCTSKPWKHTVLAMRMLNLKIQWNYNALFDYVDRWVSSGIKISGDTCAPFDNVLWTTGPTDRKNYGTAYGPSPFAAGSKSCIPGAGRFFLGPVPANSVYPLGTTRVQQIDGGLYNTPIPSLTNAADNVQFGDELWTWCKALTCAPGM
jgi:hypothetical protein